MTKSTYHFQFIIHCCDPVQLIFTQLQVDWNMIRLDGAVDFAQSLSINDTLTYLDLSFNSLGTEGGVMLGVSILTNKRYR